MTEEIEYQGYLIEPVHHAFPYFHNGDFHWSGWVVTRNHINMVPGAVWFMSADEARMAVDCLDEAKGDANHFWHLMREPLVVTVRAASPLVPL